MSVAHDSNTQPENAADAPPPAKTAPDESLLHRGGKWLGIL